jgi:hypothetical protein
MRLKLICWATMALSLASVAMIGWLGATYAMEGTGLNPWIGVPLAAVMLGLGGLAAHLADKG